MLTESSSTSRIRMEDFQNLWIVQVHFAAYLSDKANTSKKLSCTLSVNWHLSFLEMKNFKSFFALGFLVLPLFPMLCVERMNASNVAANVHTRKKVGWSSKEKKNNTEKVPHEVSCQWAKEKSSNNPKMNGKSHERKKSPSSLGWDAKMCMQEIIIVPLLVLFIYAQQQAEKGVEFSQENTKKRSRESKKFHDFESDFLGERRLARGKTEHKEQSYKAAKYLFNIFWNCVKKEATADDGDRQRHGGEQIYNTKNVSSQAEISSSCEAKRVTSRNSCRIMTTWRSLHRIIIIIVDSLSTFIVLIKRYSAEEENVRWHQLIVTQAHSQLFSSSFNFTFFITALLFG